MSPTWRWLSLLAGLLSPLAVAADELPPRALARFGGYQFYQGGYKITCAAISPNGSRIATAGHSNVGFGPVVVLWDGATGERVGELEAEDGNLYDLAFSPDGKRLAAGCRYRDADKTTGVCVVLFDVASGKKRLRVVGFESDLLSVRFAADGKQIHVTESEGPVTAWDAATGKKLFECKPPEPPPVKRGEWQIQEVAREGVLSPDGKTVAWRMHWLTLEKDGTRPVVEITGGVGVLETTVVRVHNAVTGKLLFRKERQDESFD